MDMSLPACSSVLTHAIHSASRSKIETIGDEYMAAAGLLSQRRQHAAAALAFGLRAHGAARACGLRVRVGVHSGPVTSGLVGRVRARFCLFGGACLPHAWRLRVGSF